MADYVSSHNQTSNQLDSTDQNASLRTKDPAMYWKALLAQPSEPVYLAPSLTRTPTPPLLIDRNRSEREKEWLDSPTNGTSSPVRRRSAEIGEIASSSNSISNHNIHDQNSNQNIDADQVRKEPNLKVAPLLNFDDVIRRDASTSEGALSNGLSYFVNGNCLPRKRVYLRLVVKVGSIHEEISERGFCHLVEHMLFRHTENFKDNEIQHFLSSIGARPGADSNATTYYDHTIFNLMIPVDERTTDHGFAYLNMGIQVLAEMAMKAQFTEYILEQERRIVLEECRLHSTSFKVRNAKASKASLCGTPYHDKAPIGDISIINKCTVDDITRFYKKWYRLERMAVIAVGGFKDNQILIDLINKHFSELPKAIATNIQLPYMDDTIAIRRKLIRSGLKQMNMKSPKSSQNETISQSHHEAEMNQEQENQKQQQQQQQEQEQQQKEQQEQKEEEDLNVQNDVVLNALGKYGPRFTLIRNRDDSQSHVVVMFRYVEPALQSTIYELKVKYTIHILSWLLNNRANLLVNAYLGRMIDLVASENRLTSTVRVFEIGFTSAIGCELETLGKVFMEIERLKRFLIAEEDLYQIKLVASELALRSRELKKSGIPSESEADRIIKHYLYNEPLEDYEMSYHIYQRIIESWTTQDIQQTAKEVFDLNSSVLFVALPENQTHPNDSTDRSHPKSKSPRKEDKKDNQHVSIDSDDDLTCSDAHIPNPLHASSSNIDLDRENQLYTNKDDQKVVSPDLSESDFLDVIQRVEKMELDPIYYYKATQILDENDLPPVGRVLSSSNRGPNVFTFLLDNGARVQFNSVSILERTKSLGYDIELTAEGGLAELWYSEGISAFYCGLLSSSFAKYISIGDVPLGTCSFELGVVLEQLDSFLFERRAKFSSLPNRLETMLQVIRNMFTRHPSSWPDEFCKQEMELMLEHARTATRESKIRERSISLSWQNNPLIRPLTEREFKKIRIDICKRWFERAFSNPSEFLFNLTGDFSTPSKVQNALDLVLKYIGSIPSRSHEPDYNPDVRASRLIKTHNKVAKSIKFRSGIKQERLFEAEEGTAQLLLTFPAPSFKTQLENDVAEVVTFMLESYLFQILRSHLARVYSVAVSTTHHFGPFFPGEISIQFTCDPNHANHLITKVFEAIEDLQIHGPSHRLLESCRTIYRKKKEVISTHELESDGIKVVFGQKVATRDLDLLLDNKLAKWLFNLLLPLDNYTQVIMLPESCKPPKPKSSIPFVLANVALFAAAAGTIFAAVSHFGPLKKSS